MDYIMCVPNFYISNHQICAQMKLGFNAFCRVNILQRCERNKYNLKTTTLMASLFENNVLATYSLAKHFENC